MENTSLIRTEGLAVFQEDHEVLTDVSIEVQRSELVYLVGKVGSGKSSLIKTLYADLPVRRGNANVAGYDLSALDTTQRPFFRRKLGMVFQDFQLLHDRTVNDNLDFVLRATGWKKNRERRIDEVLEKVGMPHKRDAMPYKLSGGEFQRVAIARALLNNPDVILADEPTGNLDPETTEGIGSLLHHLSEAGRAVLIATHDHSLIRRFEGRILRCESNTVTEIDYNQL